MPNIPRPRGTRDFGPEEMSKRRAVESVLRKTADNFGYREIATPTFEHSELYIERSGEAIKNEMYMFKDKGGRELSLRPELTMPTMRFFAEGMRDRSKPIKVYYFGNCFRYERPQSGRFREFWQFGAEIIGCGEYEGDADIIALAVHSLKNSKLEGFVTRIGHLGILRGILSEIGVKDDLQSKCMQLIDKGELDELYQMLQTQDVAEEGLGKIKSLLALEKSQTIPDEINEILKGNVTAQDALKNLGDILRMLKALGVSDFTIDLGIARGLDYYTGMVFEIDVPTLGAEKQVCGGGAYSLAELFGAKPTVSTGFAIGFDRVMMALERQNAEPEVPRLMVYMIPLGEESRERSMNIAARLRENQISCDIALLNRNISKHMKHANAQNARYAIIIGEDEIAKEEASVKDMESGEQKEVRFDELIQFFKSQEK